MVERILWLLVGLSWLYWLSVWWGMRRYLSRESQVRSVVTPPVSILKPVKGMDDEAYQNFASFCRQHDIRFEVLFGFADPNDPAVPLVAQLQREFPHLPIRAFFVPERTANPKCSILAELAEQARHDVLVLADSDIRIPPDTLRRVVAPLHDSRVGLVTCPYRTIRPRTLAAALESLYFNTTFVPLAIAANTLFGTTVSFGATLALRKDDLERIGGFRAIGDYLSDDYQLARRIEQLGKRLVLADVMVANVIGRSKLDQQWNREVRLARGIRRLCPYRYYGLLLTFPLPLAALLLLASGATGSAGLAAAFALILRLSFGAWVLRHFDGRQSSFLPLLPVRDVLSAVVWGFSAFGRHVTWRGQSFALDRDGRLRPAGESFPLGRRFLRGLIRSLDGMLRRCYGISEFSQRDDCLLRLSPGRAEHDVQLSDGTQIRKGEAIGDLHYWNEHVTGIDFDTDLKSGRTFRQQIHASLRELARFVETRPEWDSIKAFRADLPYNGRDASRSLARMARFFGVDVLERPRPASLWERLHDQGEQWLLRALIWAYNPGKLQTGRFPTQRWHVWLSREVLLNKFGAAVATSGNGRDSGTPSVGELRGRLDEGQGQLRRPLGPPNPVEITRMNTSQ